MAGNVENFYKLSTHEALILLNKLQFLKENFLKLWGIHNLDILLVPTIGVPAYKHDFSNDLNPFAVYTFIGSLFDIPAGNVPITLIGENETIYDEKRITNRDSISKKAQENLIESPGMPVGIQVCGRYFEDEKCVNIMKQIEIGIGFSKNHGFPI